MSRATRLHLPGPVEKPYQSANLTFTAGTYTPDDVSPAHAHRQAGFYLILQGMHSVQCRKVSRMVDPGTLVFHPPEELHQCWFHTETKIFEIYLEPSWLEQRHPHLTSLDCPSEHSTGALTHLAVRAYEEFRIQDGFSALVLEGLALEILAGIARCNIPDSSAVSNRPPRWLRETCDLLHERFTESLSLDEIAQAVGVHPAHLGRMFRRYYHTTIGEYLRDLRLKSACRMLSTSDAPLAEIALSCGYADQSHFATACKRQTGLTPTQYRRIFYKR